MSEPTPPRPSVPEARAVPPKGRRPSLVWIVPVVAALAGAWVGVTRYLAEGPEITIFFRSADGLEAGKTKIRYNGVDVGTLATIRLSDDHRKVVATARMESRTEGLLAEDTTFWVVRPRISGATVSGLDTLLSGAYVGMDIGTAKKRGREFTALADPPVVTGDVQGRFFHLRTPTLGSLDEGTPIYFRRLQVGEVSSYLLDEDGRALDVKIFVKAPYDQYVTSNTRFWQASGIDLSLSAEGLSVQTQSLLSILIGGIAFETPASGPVLPPADEDATFPLYADRKQAFEPPPRDPQTYLLVFEESVRGLVVGAPVEFQGIRIGEVSDIRAQVDVKTLQFSVPITVRLDAERMGVDFRDVPDGADVETIRRAMVERLVARGVRAQLRTGSLLTGSLFIALDFFPDAAPVKVDWAQSPPRIPTVPGELQAIEANVASIIRKIDRLPFQELGDDLAKSLVSFDETLASAKSVLDNANRMVEPDSVLGAELGGALQEVSRAARSLRVLADYLERHPEALLRGKAGEAK